jgi:spore coat protein JB
MNERDSMMRRIKSIDFAMWELHIFLDTHPNDTEALALHEKYSKRRDALVAEYEQRFGMLGMKNITGENRWQWVNDPWPWDITQEVENNVGL